MSVAAGPPLQYMTVFYDKFLLFFCGKHENNNSLEFYENVSRECSATRLGRTQQKLLRKPWRTPFSLSDIFNQKKKINQTCPVIVTAAAAAAEFLCL
jgi:hypothetical protein